MASTQSLSESDNSRSFDFFSTVDLHKVASYRRLGSVNGFIIGFVIAISYFLPKVLELSSIPMGSSNNVGLVATGLGIILLCTVTGWITTRISKTVVTVLLWGVTAVLATTLLGFLPSLTSNWATWIIDSRFADLEITTVPDFNLWWNFAIAGYILIVAIFILSILQEYRLEKAHMELSEKNRLTFQAFLILFVPALLTGIGALVMPDFNGAAPRHALRMTHQGIQEGRLIEGDLFEVSLETGFNYSALKGVREQLDGEYQLMLGEVDGTGSTIVTVANFDSGEWINCRVNADLLMAKYFSFCAEAQRPYTIGFSSLITGDPVPENCFRCLPAIEPEWQSWLEERATGLGTNATFKRVSQQGRFVLARASSSDGDYAIECMFEGLEKVTLLSCTEVE